MRLQRTSLLRAHQIAQRVAALQRDFQQAAIEISRHETKFGHYFRKQHPMAIQSQCLSREVKMTASLENQLSDLRTRLQKLEESAKPKPAWKRIIGDVQTAAIVLTVIGGVITFYDQVYLKWKDRAQEEANSAIGWVRDLEDINEDVYRLNIENRTEDVSAILEAKQGRRERVINETYLFWTRRPDDFYPREKQTIANSLSEIGLHDEALEMIADLEDDYVSTVAKSDLNMFEGRVLSARNGEGDMDAARQKFKSAMRIASELERITKTENLWAKTAHIWLYWELENFSDCEQVLPVASALRELVQRPDFPIRIEGLAQKSDEFIAVAADRCA
ncbi:MAG: hypothetical protein AB8B85_13100 [Paracoccaceae bacterium]